MILWALMELLLTTLQHLPWQAKLWIICHIDRILACVCFSAAWLIASLPGSEPTSPEK
jgi:hypothetical protein